MIITLMAWWDESITKETIKRMELSSGGVNSFKQFRERQSVSQSVQSLSCVQLFATPWIEAFQGSLSITKSRSLPKLMSIELVMPSNNLILCCPLLLPPSIHSHQRPWNHIMPSTGFFHRNKSVNPASPQGRLWRLHDVTDLSPIPRGLLLFTCFLEGALESP